VSKVILLSAVIAIIALPIRAASEKNPKVGLKKAMTYLIVFNVLYVLALRFFVHM
jgi:hypothetical protein